MLATETATQVEGNTGNLTSLEEEIALLRHEMRQFKTTAG
jgi:hypothetical protein